MNDRLSSLVQITKDPFDFAVDQGIDLEFIEAVRLLELPGAGTANNNFRPGIF